MHGVLLGELHAEEAVLALMLELVWCALWCALGRRDRVEARCALWCVLGSRDRVEAAASGRLWWWVWGGRCVCGAWWG